VILFIAYLPASSFLFFLKNDAFNGYFPPKFFMSESLHAGYLPLWNPYINFGIPQYGDMSSGFWSPITWLIAATVGYNAYSFTLELFFYLLISGTGVYILCKQFKLHPYACFIAGISFMCCGYMVGHLQHFNWISGAAFLPYCIWAYLRLQKKLSLKNMLAASLMFYMLISSAHPGITIGAIYFFTALALFDLLKKIPGISFMSRCTGFIKTNAILFAAVCLLSVGMIAGYADILPNMTRGEKVDFAAALSNPVSIASWLSSILPLSIVKNDALFNTDVSMRNIYFGLCFFLFFLYACIRKKHPLQIFFLITGAAFLLLSTGGIFKTFAYHYLPLIAYVRLDGEFVIFALLCFIIVAAFALSDHIQSNGDFDGKLKFLYYFLEVLLAASILIAVYNVFSRHESFVYHIQVIKTAAGLPMKLKTFIDQISFYDTLWLQGVIQLLLLWGIKFCLKGKRFGLLVKLCVADMIIVTLLNVPFTGVGKASVAQVQAVLNKSPKKIPVPPLLPIIKNDTINTEETGLVGNWSFYNKQPGVLEYAPYPIELNSMKNIFSNQDTLFAKPYLFTTSSAERKLIVTGFTGSSVTVSGNFATNDSIVLQQNYYRHWYYISAGKKYPALTYKGIFNVAPVTAGTNELKFVFEPVFIMNMMIVSAICFGLFFLSFVFLFSKTFFFKNKQPQ
jgi:hypothetical protein